MRVFVGSLLFNIGFYGFTAITVLTSLPLLLLPRGVLVWVLRSYTWWVELMLRAFCGIRVQVEGAENIPPGAVLIVSKHQSAFDTVFWLSRLPDPCYIMKIELMRLPLWGMLARKLEMVAVDRDGGAPALRLMVKEVKEAADAVRQIVIYPEGTRAAPGVTEPYQPGVAAIAGATRLTVVPVATNSGVFWGRKAFSKRPGVIRVKVLPALPPGLNRARLMAALEERIETESRAMLTQPPSSRVAEPAS
jgi:1-acyl-sn-glycerol-3-phosphate acyltransferase